MLEATGVLPGHRELFVLPHGPSARRAAAHPVRVPARQCPGVHRREPRHGAADRRHVSSGDFRRKATLAEYGFRLPSCMDNRPLRFEEWDAMRPQTVHVSATPGPWEMERAQGRLRRAGDPPDRPHRSADRNPARPAPRSTTCVGEIRDTVQAQGYRSLVTVLTKRMAEDLTEYLHDNAIKVRYMHSDIDTIERIEIIRDLRLGVFDVLVGINLLREGLDIPECALVADARRRQGRVSALRDLPGADHRPRGPQRRRQGDPLCRQDRDRLHGARHRRDRSRRREKQDGLQHRSTALRRPRSNAASPTS